MATTKHAPKAPPALIAAAFSIAAAAWLGLIALHGILQFQPMAALDEVPAGLMQFMSICGRMPEYEGPGLVNWMAGWTLMVMAMMLPPALPLFRTANSLAADRRDRHEILAAVALAFVAVWCVAGLLLYGLGSAARAGLLLTPAWLNQPPIWAGLAAIAAGVFQFTPLKMACMDACRSPLNVMMTHWQPSMPIASALRIGRVYGMICVGCCWAMMLLCVLVGAFMLPIMVLTAVIMMLERLSTGFRPLIPLQAGIAIGLGVLLITGALPTGFAIG